MLRTIIRRVEGTLITSCTCSNNLNSVYYQTVRWGRKPRWVPTAKSKVFRVNVRKKIPEDEYEELKRLHQNYKTEMKSIRAFFAAQLNNTSYKSDNISVILEDEDVEHKRCFEINEKWNTEVRKLREETLTSQKEAELEEILKTIEENKVKVQKRQQEVEEIVRKEKEKAKSYITPENIDEAIDNAIENVVDHNFAIDLEGNYYHGRNSKPPKLTKPPAADEKDEPDVAAATA